MNKPLPKRKNSLRLEGYQYNTPGYYHVVIVTENRFRLLGKMENSGVELSDFGKILFDFLTSFSEYNKNVEITKFEIMPDHVHLLINLMEGENFSDPPYLSDLVRKIKTIPVSTYRKQAQENGWESLPTKFWQRSYYDHILRSNEDISFTFDYIEFNPYRDEM